MYVCEGVCMCVRVRARVRKMCACVLISVDVNIVLKRHITFLEGTRVATIHYAAMRYVSRYRLH